jgi:diguanylate cyclase (GGDEF)-like protein
MEIEGDTARFFRSNHSFQDFAKQFFNLDILEESLDFKNPEIGKWKSFISAVRRCCKGGRIFFDEKAPDGFVFHFFARRLHVNRVTGSTAVAITVLSISEPDENTTYADIARSLAADYYNLFVIDLDTNSFTEYSSQVGGEELSVVRHGEDFFTSAKRDTMTRIYEEDREPFLALFTKENVLRDLDRQGVFTTTYRLIDTGTPMYVNMKVTRLRGGNRLILGISIIDSNMKQQEEDKKLRQEQVSLGRIAALSPDYIVLYTIDPVTGHYTQYNPSKEFKSFGLAKQGDDFFADVVLDAPKAIAPEDMERHLRVFTKENVLRGIRENGLFVHHYRMIMDGKIVPSSLKATLIRENDGEKIILGVTSDEEEYRRKLENAYKKANSTAVIYNHVAHALARGYTDLFYVNMDTDEFIEFHTDDERGVLNEARRGSDFFEGCERDAKLYVHQEDQAAFVKTMNRQFLEETLTGNKVFELTYRRIKGGEPFYVLMKVSRMEDDNRFIVIAVQDIDELMRQRRAEERREEERIVYTRLHALTGNYICIYVVEPETGNYREFSATANYEESLKQAKEGEDFFTTVREAALTYNYPEDLKRFLSAFTKDNIMAEVKRSGIFTLVYRLMMDGKPVYVQLKAAMVEEKEGPRLIVGIYDIDAQVRQEEEFGKQLAQAQTQATIDALTGIKNKYAYLAAEARLNSQIAEHDQPPFAIVILDVNDLKKVNDTAGHQAGDRYLRDACKIICETFKRSPVFRMGGDEFAVIAQGSDYERIEELIECVSNRNTEAAGTGGIVIACGMSKFDNDASVAAVFERADHNMYENKRKLKRE